MMRNDAEKMLLVQLKQIGDVLMITPGIRALATTRPNAEIHVLTQSPSDQIFRYNPHVHRVHLYPPDNHPIKLIRLIRDLRDEHFAAVLDFSGLPKTALFCRLTGIRKRIGFHKRGRTLFYTHSVHPEPGSSYTALKQAQLLTALGIAEVTPQLDFPVGDRDREAAGRILSALNRDPQKRLVSVSPVSRREYKVWPAERFAGICDFLVESCQAQVLFLWGPGEHHFIQAVREKMHYDALPDYEVPTISETVALLHHVDLHIGNDNGPMHFAIAAGVRTVAVFGRPLLRNWTPPGQERHRAVEHDPGCKENCHYPTCGLECIRDIPVSRVLEEVKRQLNPDD